MDSDTPSPVIVTLAEEDVEGAMLQEPLDSCTVEQLRWWLLCHGIAAKVVIGNEILSRGACEWFIDTGIIVL